MNEITFNPKILKDYFDDSVREACRSCKRYGHKRTCPPDIESVDYYRKLLPSYERGLLIYKEFPVNLEHWKESGKQSSLEIQNYLLKKRHELFVNSHILNLALGAGSCKICEKCNERCNFPDKALIPIEGIGINVVKLMKRWNVDIKFPVERELYYIRVGIILWKK